MDWTMFWTTVMLPALLPILGTVVTGFVSYAAVYAAKHFKINIEQKARDAIVAAILHGIEFALSKGRSLDSTVIVDEVTDYVKSNLPDTLKKVNAKPGDLRRLSTALIEEYKKMK